MIPTDLIKQLESSSSVPVRNIAEIGKTIEFSRSNNCPVPIILTLCPAITNLDKPNEKGQTRKLEILQPDNPRLVRFVSEFVELNKKVVDSAGIPIETMLIFADVLENGASQMFTNTDSWNDIAGASRKNIVAAFAQFDRDHPGVMQNEKFRIPKVRLQSDLLVQAGKIGLDHREQIRQAELMCLDPKSELFEIFIKHIRQTADTPFVSTGFQTIKSAETVWNRVRFMLSQNIADGVVLPRLMAELHKSQFPNGMPTPIFISSTTRPGGIDSELDGFTFNNNHPAMAIFKNIGSWMKES